MRKFGNLIPELPIRSALLLGRNSHDLGQIDAIAEGYAAITLCRGGARKSYHHTDPNEDAALFATGEGGILIAVADGHRGYEGSEIALQGLLEDIALKWTDTAPISDQGWPTRALTCLCDLNHALVRNPARATRELFRTTLTVGLLRPEEQRLYFFSMGDSHLFLVDSRGARDLVVEKSASGNPCFLGDCEETVETLRDKCVVDSMNIPDDAWAIVAATDGISEQGIGFQNPAATIASLARKQRNPLSETAQELAEQVILDFARAITEEAINVQRSNRAGDNIAIAACGIPARSEGE